MSGQRQGYNLIAVFNPAADRLLMCKRKKPPYLGLFNLVGGKIEAGEAGQDAAYRELWEETGISREDIRLTHLMDFTYYLDPCYVEVYVGQLDKEQAVFGEENDLFWSSLDHDFFDMSRYAGEGNLGHVLEQVRLFQKQLLHASTALPPGHSAPPEKDSTAD